MGIFTDPYFEWQKNVTTKFFHMRWNTFWSSFFISSHFCFIKLHILDIIRNTFPNLYSIWFHWNFISKVTETIARRKIKENFKYIKDQQIYLWLKNYFTVKNCCLIICMGTFCGKNQNSMNYLLLINHESIYLSIYLSMRFFVCLCVRVCVCVCVCVLLYVCMYVCMYVYTRVL